MFRWLLRFLAVLLAFGTIGALLLALAVVLMYPKLPSIEAVTRYQPHLPLRVYTADSTLIGEFGEEHRELVKLNGAPTSLRLAVLAAEDARFYEHGAVDYSGILRAALTDLRAGSANQGASTITMQLVRNLFLTREKTLSRKFSEVLLAYKIEQSLTKDEILERYINQVYLGQGAYGFAAAAKVYFCKPLGDLSLAEIAILAGLPKAPSQDNPIANIKRAKNRQRYVLARMRELGYVDVTAYQAALAEPLHICHHRFVYNVHADYVAEMARQAMYDQYGENAYTLGYRVYTTLRDTDQAAADEAVRRGVLAYDLRHGYRGPEGFVNLPDDPVKRDQAISGALREQNTVNGLQAAVVLRVGGSDVEARLKNGEVIHIHGAGLKFAARALKPETDPQHRLRTGALIRVQTDAEKKWEITQLPEVQAALVSLDPKNGAIVALCGGFDFDRNMFNHVTQAFRQPGSSFKPFIYSAALEKGFTPASIIDDAPLVIPPSYPGGKSWAPRNYEGDYMGPISFSTALAKSRNVVSVRILESIGVAYARDYATRFGFPPDQIPPYPTMVLGVGSFTPLQMAAAYSVFANGGYRVVPYFIDRIIDSKGNLVHQAHPGHTSQAPVIDPRNAFLMTNVMRDVIEYGTGARAASLGRHDLAGKTGSTNNYVDAWFDGYNPELVATAWIGFDHPHSLGRGEVGARAALPIWMDYMGKALNGVLDRPLTPPAGVVVTEINPADGLRVPDGQGDIVKSGVWPICSMMRQAASFC